MGSHLSRKEEFFVPHCILHQQQAWLQPVPLQPAWGTEFFLISLILYSKNKKLSQ